MVLVFRLTIRNALSGGIASETLPVRIRCDGLTALPRRTADFKAHLSRALTAILPKLRAMLQPEVAQRLEHVRRIDFAAGLAKRLREMEIAGELRSTARELVQAGLFDRRALRSHRMRVRMLADGFTRNLAAGEEGPACVLEATLDLCAVFCGALS